jgi:NADH dehydrogenase
VPCPLAVRARISIIAASIDSTYISVKTELSDGTAMTIQSIRTGTRVLVLGGAGFIGRHAVAALVQRRCQVIVGSRHPLRIDHRLPASAVRCARRQVRFEALQDSVDWEPLLAGVDVVVNCVGILRQRGRETYERVHHRAPAALARTCAALAIRLVHVSALGLHPDAGSRFLRSKLAGEHAVRAAGGDWRLVRPSLLDGPGGYGARWLRLLAQLPLHVFPADARGRIAALHVDDLGEALARLATEPGRGGDDREFDLGGTEALPLADYLRRLRDPQRLRALRVPLPGWLARAASHACDVLHVSPFSYGHWELLRQDNTPAPNRLAELLGRDPRPVGAPAGRAEHAGRGAPPARPRPFAQPGTS